MTSNTKTFIVRTALLMPLISYLLAHPLHAQTNADWYMAGANPQRTGWVTEEVRGALNIDWYQPIEPYIPYKIQPVFDDQTAYVSTSKGLYAFNLNSSYPAATSRIKWVYPTELPLGHSPTIKTINNIKVAYVGGFDGKIHAVNTTTGQKLTGYTSYIAGAGFDTNPLVIHDTHVTSPTIFAGSRDGYFYAFDAASGELKWLYQTQGPILYSAAYKNNVIYFASNDNHAYALNAITGDLIWKSTKFDYTAGFHFYWPVLFTDSLSQTDYLIYSGDENYRGSENLNLVDMEENYFIPGCRNLPGPPCPDLIFPTSTASSNSAWPLGTHLFDTREISTYFETYPHRRMVYILNPLTGQEVTFDHNSNTKPDYAPITYAGGATAGGTMYPPIINGVNNTYYQSIMYYGGGWIGRGAAVGWKPGNPFMSRVATEVGFAVDEPIAYAGGGRLLYWSLCCDREAGSFDATMTFDQPNRSWYYWGYNLLSKAPGYQSMYDDGGESYTNGNGWQVYSGKNKSKNGVYGKHGTNQSPPIPYAGKVYILKGNALISLTTNSASPNPSPLPLAPTQPVTHTPNQKNLNGLLTHEVQKMLASGHLRPAYFTTGSTDNIRLFYDLNANPSQLAEILDYFQNPADTVYTLLLAYPHLPALQNQIKTYLQTYYGPGAPYDFTRIVHSGYGSGTPREAFTIPPEEFSSSSGIGKPYQSPLNASTTPTCGFCGYWQNFPPFNFYAAWKYAQIVGNGDQTFARNIFNAMSNKIEPPPQTAYLTTHPYFINYYAAGYLGFLELKKLSGLGGDTTVQGYYNQMLTLRVSSFSKDTPFYSVSQFNIGGFNYQRTFAVARNYMFLTPEIAAYLRQQLLSPTQIALAEYQSIAPYWFVARSEGTYGEGSYQHLYDTPALFQAKAWILQESQSELIKYLDSPAFPRGDLFYIQNLVAAIEAPASSIPTPTLTPSPNYSLDNDTDVDIFDVVILLSRFTLSGPGDFNQNGRVDILDFNTLLRQR